MAIKRQRTVVIVAVTLALLTVPLASVPVAASTQETTTTTQNVAAQNATTTDAGPPGGSLVIVGGSLERGNAEIWTEIIDRGGGTEQANVAIVPAANSDPAGAGTEVKDIFSSTYGVPSENVSVLPLAVDDSASTDVDESAWSDNADNQSVVNTVENATVVYFVGGAQHKIVEVLKHDNGTDTPVGAAIRDVYSDRDGVIAGSSAGAAIMSDDMIGAGESFDTVNRGISTFDTYNIEGDSRAWLTEGMGYLDHGMVDQHFQQRGRIGRLVRVMWHEDASFGYERQNLGYGIGEATALVFTENSNWASVIGDNYVTVVDISNATEVVDTEDGALELEGAKYHLLSKGDAFNYEKKTFRVADQKSIDVISSPYYGNGPSVSPFAQTGLQRLATRGVADNKNAGEASAQVWQLVQNQDSDEQILTGVVVTLAQTDETTGMFGDDNYEDTRNRYLITNLSLGINVRKVPLEDEEARSTPTPRVETVTVTKTVYKTPEQTTTGSAPDTTSTGSGPGFTVVGSLLALLGAALLGLRRRDD